MSRAKRSQILPATHARVITEPLPPVVAVLELLPAGLEEVPVAEAEAEAVDADAPVVLELDKACLARRTGL